MREDSKYKNKALYVNRISNEGYREILSFKYYHLNFQII
ncbi:hypothetical protein OXIME_000102 [Oxyplasma meridianum]|uniref:Uncharacterized protein n=1 Tax=Oxyplasma meridianum TaxID=3073602 RepID=A0AAX4NEC9_9ARCH